MSYGCKWIRSKPPILRSYSLSDLPADDHFRISVKSEANGIGSSYLCTQVRAGDVLDVSAPRGVFTLRPGDNPVVLLSAGVGATPVLSMLHALAAETSERQVWWIHGARNRSDHPFAQESRLLVKQLSHGRSYIVYSRPTATDQLQVDFDASGHVDVVLLEKIGVPRNGDFYLCGPPHSCKPCVTGCKSGVWPPRTSTWKSLARLTRLHPVWHRLFILRTRCKDLLALARQCRSRVAGSPFLGILNSRACSNWLRRATFQFDGHAGPGYVTPA